MNTTFYIIRNKDGKFARAGQGYFGDNPKFWHSIGAVKLHLKMFPSIPEDWQIIPISLSPDDSLAFSAKELMDQHEQSRIDRQERWVAADKKRRLASIRRQMKALEEELARENRIISRR